MRALALAAAAFSVLTAALPAEAVPIGPFGPTSGTHGYQASFAPEPGHYFGFYELYEFELTSPGDFTAEAALTINRPIEDGIYSLALFDPHRVPVVQTMMMEQEPGVGRMSLFYADLQPGSYLVELYADLVDVQLATVAGQLDVSIAVTPVPLPAALLGSGLVALAAWRRRRHTSARG